MNPTANTMIIKDA